MCLACETTIQPEALEAFGNQYIEILNHSALGYMIGLGHRTGLFNAMHRLGPATSGSIAEAAGLHERYVREWLGAVTTGGIVECDATGTQFSLPPAHAAMLAPEAGGESLAHLSRFVGMFSRVEDQLAECFHKGGGVPYEAFPEFHEIMAEDSAQTVVAGLFDHLLPLIPDFIERLENGIDVLDVGCGRGRALLRLAEHFPESRFTGWDLSAEAIEWANREAARLELRNVKFEPRDLSDFHRSAPEAQFDLVTAFDAIHDQARPDHVLAGIRRTLKPGGCFFMQDIAASSNVAENLQHPIGPLIYTISCSHCMTVSLAQGGLGVGAAWGENLARRFLKEAGFPKVERHTLEHDFQNYYYVMRV